MKVNLIDTFRDFTEYRAWIAKAYGNLSSLNANLKFIFTPQAFNKRGGKVASWYGPGTTFAELEAGIDRYASPELLDEMLEKIRLAASTERLQREKSKRMRFNDMGLGNFSFDRAAMGIYRVKEYFSPVLGRRVEENETKLAKDRRVLVADGTVVEERWEQRPDGMPRARTTSRKVFAYFPKVDQSVRAVSIVVSAGGPYTIKANDFLYSGLSAIVLAQLLEQVGIRTTIHVLLGTVVGSDKYGIGGTFNGCLVPAKGRDEAIDRNLIAMVTSDPRFFRFEGFKGLISAHDTFGSIVPIDLGNIVSKRQIEMVMASRTHGRMQADKLVCIKDCFSEEAALRVIEAAIQEIAT